MSMGPISGRKLRLRIMISVKHVVFANFLISLEASAVAAAYCDGVPFFSGDIVIEVPIPCLIVFTF